MGDFRWWCGGGHLKRKDKKAFCCPSGVTFVDGQAVRSGSSAVGTAPEEVIRSGHVSGPRCLREGGLVAGQEASVLFA